MPNARIVRSILCFCLLPMCSAFGSPYLDNPLAQWVVRQSFEARFEIQTNFDGNENPPAAFLAGIGYQASELLTLGLYGLTRSSDRRLPKRMRGLVGFGGYTEMRLPTQGAVTPFGGLRVGLLDPKGPGYGNAFHLGAQVGVLIPLTPRLFLSLAGGAQVTQKDFFNYREKGDGRVAADNTDMTIDVGLRAVF